MDLLQTIATPDLREQMHEIDRELAQRARVYPRFVADRKLSQERADYQCHCLRAAWLSIDQLHGSRQRLDVARAALDAIARIVSETHDRPYTVLSTVQDRALDALRKIDGVT